MTQKTGEAGIGLGGILVALFVLGMLLQLFKGNETTTTTSQPPDRNSIEHRYVRERFRQEGYNSSEAQQAADAIIRFHEAQKNR